MSTARPTWSGFVLWAIVGFACAFALFAFIPFVAGVMLASVIVAIVRPAWFSSGIGALAGVGGLSLYVAFVQRHGPGTVCWQTATAAGCSDYLNPWPWLMAGLAMIAVAITVHARQVRHLASSAPRV
jgi:hypothetical protein